MYEILNECPLCEGADFSEMFEVKDALATELLRKVNAEDDLEFLSSLKNHLTACENCGLVFLNPRLKAESLSRLYGLWYGFGYQEIFEDDRLIEQRRKEFKQRHFKLMNKYFNKPGRLLDVGCGTGLYLDVCRRRGWEVEGIEFNRRACLYAKEVFDLDVFNGDFLSFNHQGKKYDALTMFDFLEHTANPVENINYAYELLRPGGIMILRVPNLEGLQARVMKQKWYGIISTHLLYLTQVAIQRLLEKSGFETLEIGASNYTDLHSILFRHITYVGAKLKRRLYSKGNVPPASPSQDIQVADRPRATEYLGGIMMELVDFIGGTFNRGNNQTIVAIKK